MVLVFCREQSHCQFDLKDIIYSRLSPRIMWFSNNSSISIQWCTRVCSWWRLITLTPKVYILSIQSASYQISQNQCCGITEQTWTCKKSCTQQGKKEKKRERRGNVKTNDSDDFIDHQTLTWNTTWFNVATKCLIGRNTLTPFPAVVVVYLQWPLTSSEN